MYELVECKREVEVYAIVCETVVEYFIKRIDDQEDDNDDDDCVYQVYFLLPVVSMVVV